MDARSLSVGFFCLLLIVSCAFIASADPLDTWHWINPQPQGNSLNSVIFGNDLFVAFGDAGGIITSPDGENWTPRATGTVKALHGSIFGNGMFVAVGEGGTIVTSPDGMSWTNRPSVADSLLRGVAAGNGLFVAVGDQGTIVTSPDGVTWTRQESGTSNRLSAATFGNGVFVVAAESAFLTSQDGVTWTRVAVGDADIFSTVAFGNGLFVASEIARPDFSCLFIPCYPQDKQIYVSTDGARWRAVGEKRYSTPASEALTFDNGLFIGSSNQSIDFYGVLGISTSADGVTWTPVNDLSPSGIVRGDAVFVAVRDRDIFTSPDLANWTLRTRYTVPDVSGDGSRVLSAGGMLFITFPAADEILVLRSVSTGTLVRDVTLFDVAFGNGIFVGVGGSGLSTSFDGLTWTLNVPGGDLSGIAYGNGSFVAVGSAGVSFTSPDGMSWAPRWSGTFQGFRGVRFGNGLFVALRDDNTIVTSVDGAAWTLRAAGLPGFELLDIFFDNGVFAVIGADRSTISMAADFIFMTSSDGISWRTVRAPDDVGPFSKVAFGNRMFLAVGDRARGPRGRILASIDGMQWTVKTSPTDLDLTSVGFGDNAFFIVGNRGTILRSDRLYTPEIEVNDAGGPLTLSTASELSLKVGLKTHGNNGEDADWWVVAYTPAGWFYYVYPDMWHFAPLFEDLRPAHQGPLGDIPAIEVFRASGLPLGAYSVYFAVDTVRNGRIDFDHLYLDYVDFLVAP